MVAEKKRRLSSPSPRPGTSRGRYRRISGAGNPPTDDEFLSSLYALRADIRAEADRRKRLKDRKQRRQRKAEGDIERNDKEKKEVGSELGDGGEPPPPPPAGGSTDLDGHLDDGIDVGMDKRVLVGTYGGGDEGATPGPVPNRDKAAGGADSDAPAEEPSDAQTCEGPVDNPTETPPDVQVVESTLPEGDADPGGRPDEETETETEIETELPIVAPRSPEKPSPASTLENEDAPFDAPADPVAPDPAPGAALRVQDLERRVGALLDEIGRLESRALSAERAAVSSRAALAGMRSSWDRDRSALEASVTGYRAALAEAHRRDLASVVDAGTARARSRELEGDAGALEAVAGAAEERAVRAERAGAQMKGELGKMTTENAGLRARLAELENASEGIGGKGVAGGMNSFSSLPLTVKSVNVTPGVASGTNRPEELGKTVTSQKSCEGSVVFDVKYAPGETEVTMENRLVRPTSTFGGKGC